ACWRGCPSHAASRVQESQRIIVSSKSANIRAIGPPLEPIVFNTTLRPMFCVLSMAVAITAANLAITAQGQDSPPITHPSDTSQGGVLQSPEWLAMQREFQAWLAVQQIYSTEEMTAIV